MPLFGQSGWGSGKYGIADLGPIYKNPLGYYTNLFTSEYQGGDAASQKLLQYVRNKWRPIDDLTELAQLVFGYFQISTAEGVQLDRIGELVGASRVLPFQPSNGFSPVLDDVTYRQLLYATIGINQWDGRLVSIYPIWKSVFPTGKLTINDNQNMTCTIIIAGSFTSLALDMIEHGLIIPRPEGVQYSYTTADLPIFGADLNNEYVAGADLGHAS
jgi:hypothetical protein